MIVILAICMIANATQTDVSGKWDMVALYNYRFDLDIKQSGDQILGTMTRTNGDEPVDKVQGTVSSDGTIKFDRDRPGQWVQHYTGQISSSGDSLTMGGDYAHALTGSVSAGVTSGPWTATKPDYSSGTPQVGVSTNDPALIATASQIEAKKQQINDKYLAYQRGDITYAEWWEFRNEEVASALWIAGQWAALFQLIGELSADQPIPYSTPPALSPNLPSTIGAEMPSFE